MTGRLAGSLSVLLAFAISNAWAQSPGSTSRPNGPAGVSIGRPVAAAPARTPAIAVDRPIGLPQENAERNFQPASYFGEPAPATHQVYRAKSDDSPQRIPTGIDETDALKMPEPPLAEKKQDAEQLPRPKVSQKPVVDTGNIWEGSCADCGTGVCPPSGNCCPGTCCPNNCCDANGLTCDGCPCTPECCPCCPCFGGQDHCFWFKGEYLNWQTRHGPAPALVTTGPQSSGGVLGRGATVLFGGPLDYEEQSGGRFTVGYWFDECATFGIEGVFFFLGQRNIDFTAASNGNPLLARPFFNAVTNAEDAELVANLPGGPSVIPLTGRVSVRSRSELDGAEANFIVNLCKGDCSRLDFLAGFRYLSLRESLEINEHLLIPATSPAFAGSTFDLFDEFSTRNDFYGGQVGLRKDWKWRRWDFDLSGKVALGDMHETVKISGATTITQPGMAPMTFPGGLLAQPTNIGHYSRNQFAVVPEVGFTVGYQFTEHMKFFVGYDFLYASNVVRPGSAIDRTVNPTQLPSTTGPGTLVGPARPAFVFKDTDFWAQGITIGLEFKY